MEQRPHISVGIYWIRLPSRKLRAWRRSVTPSHGRTANKPVSCNVRISPGWRTLAVAATRLLGLVAWLIVLCSLSTECHLPYAGTTRIHPDIARDGRSNSANSLPKFESIVARRTPDGRRRPDGTLKYTLRRNLEQASDCRPCVILCSCVLL